MPKYKSNYRAKIDFMNAIRERSVNYAFNTIESLSAELEELNTLFEQRNLGLTIQAQWIQRNLSCSIELSNNVGQNKTALLSVLMTPIHRKEVMLVAQKHLTEGQDITGRSHQRFAKLDDSEHRGRMADTLGKYILAATPDERRNQVKEILLGEHESDILEGHIQDKYAGPQTNAEQAKKSAYAAYEDALNYT